MLSWSAIDADADRGEPDTMSPNLMPLRGHRFHSLNDAALTYIIKDAGEAARCMRTVDAQAECKYLDQVNDACTVLNYRRRVSEASRYRFR
jgi:hypothetical protein